MLSSDYGRGRVSPEAFSSLLSSCSADPASYTYTYTSTTTTPGTTTTTAASHTCTGTTYIASGADTCESISEANGVATDLMIYRNNLDYNCTVLSAGTSLCLQDTCTIKTLDRNYTCSEITDGQSFSLLQLVSWNPLVSPVFLNTQTAVLDGWVADREPQVDPFQLRQPGQHDRPQHLRLPSRRRNL